MLDHAAQKIFGELEKENLFRGKSLFELAERLAYYFSEINVLHPFRDGNGRAQRVFISQLALSAGYFLDYSDLDQDLMYQAVEKAFFGDESDLVSLIKLKLTPLYGQLDRVSE